MLRGCFTELGGFQSKLAREKKRKNQQDSPALCSTGPISPGPLQGRGFSLAFQELPPWPWLHLWGRSRASRGGEGRVPSSPLLWLGQVPVQSSLRPSRPARGAVRRLTTFRTELRSRRDPTGHRHAAHSSSSDFCPQSACCCFIPESTDASFSVLSRTCACHQRGAGWPWTCSTLVAAERCALFL